MTTPKLILKPVTKSTWPDLEALFEGKGGPSYCWCMPFREMANRSKATNADRKAALKSRVDRRTPIGLIGYVGGEPIAWCSVAPRATFTPQLTDDYDPAETGVWSVTCFFIRRDHRKAGLSRALLDGATAYARKRGARVVEGYPVEQSSPSYRFMGFQPLFENAGFRPVGKAGSRRHVMRSGETRSPAADKRAP